MSRTTQRRKKKNTKQKNKKSMKQVLIDNARPFFFNNIKTMRHERLMNQTLPNTLIFVEENIMLNLKKSV